MGIHRFVIHAAVGRLALKPPNGNGIKKENRGYHVTDLHKRIHCFLPAGLRRLEGKPPYNTITLNYD